MRRMTQVESVKRAANWTTEDLYAESSDHDQHTAILLGAPSKRKASDPHTMGDGHSTNPTGKSTETQSVLNLVNCILGAGVLGYPFCFKSCGFLLATLMMSVVLVATRFSYQLMLYCAELSGRRTYESIAEQVLGKSGRAALELCTAALNLGAIVAYLNILADVLSSVAGTIIPPGAEPSRHTYITGVTLLGALPVGVVVRDHSVVAALSMLSVGCVVLFAMVILCLAVVHALAIAPGAAAAAIVVKSMQRWSPDGLLVAFPVMAYGFTAHPYYLGIYSMLSTPNIKRMNRVTDMALCLCSLVYWTVGIGGYALFKDRTAGDVLRNFGGGAASGLRSAYERALKLCYGFAILGSIPLVILPFYTILMPLMSPPPPSAGPAASTQQYQQQQQQYQQQQQQRASCSDGGSPAYGPVRSNSGGGGLHRDRSDAAIRERVYEAAHHHTRPADPHFHTPQAEMVASHMQHTFAVVVVLGLAMASALWLPNLELIFGLVGSTASVVIGFIMPAVLFLRLCALNPHLSGSSATAHKSLVVPQDVQLQWRVRQWLALALLVFGVVSGVLCTRATLGGIQQEKVVVQLAQDLVVHEAVVAEANRVQQKAQEAAVAVKAVESAAESLGKVQDTANNTLGALQAAAAALSTITNNSDAHPSESAGIFNIQGRIHEHKQKVKEEGVLKNIEYALSSVQEELNTTRAAVEQVVLKLDESIQSIQRSAAAAAAASADATKGSSLGADRASELARELSKALGLHSQVATSAPAGSGLEQVRTSAMSALSALGTTASVLQQVQEAVLVARHGHKRDAQVKEVAVNALQRAMNATAASALAVRITGQALSAAATAETSELVESLNRVLSDLEKSKERASGGATIKVAPEAAAGSGSGLTAASAAAGSSDAAASGSAGQPAAAAAAAAAAAGAAGPAELGHTVDAAGSAGPVGSSSSATSGAAGATAPAATAGPTGAAGGAAATATPSMVQQQQQQQQAGSSSGANASGAAAVQPTTGDAAAAGGAAGPVQSTAATPGAATAAAGGGGNAKTETTQQIQRVKDVIGRLTDVLSSTSNATQAAVASGDVNKVTKAANVSALAAVVQETVAAAEGSKQAVMGAIKEKLESTDAKVVSRVVDIVQDIQQEKVKEGQQQQQQQAATMDAAAAAAAAVAEQRQQQQQQLQQQHQLQEQQQQQQMQQQQQQQQLQQQGGAAQASDTQVAAAASQSQQQQQQQQVAVGGAQQTAEAAAQAQAAALSTVVAEGPQVLQPQQQGEATARQAAAGPIAEQQQQQQIQQQQPTQQPGSTPQ